MALLQIKIYTRKFFRTFKRESIISIFIGIIITILVMSVTQENMFANYEGTKSGIFSLICVCIWIGIFNSIQLVCREKNDIVKDELDKSLQATSYMAAHFIYQFFLCLIQSVIVFSIFQIYMDGKGYIGSSAEYLITIFLVTFASDAMAFVISCAVPTPLVAMTVMPLLLLIQLVMAGVLFELKGSANAVANFTVSKWGMSALARTGSICKIPSRMNLELPGLTPPSGSWISEVELENYASSSGVSECWLFLIIFIVAFYGLSVFALKFTTRKMKK